jgi:tRNA threonylcarbamoyladenosine modification (KEOPS) complex  Pcc1 subunit
MICSAFIEINLKTKEMAGNLFNSLLPDNINIPKDLKLKMDVKEKRVYMEIYSLNINRFQSTIEEILRLISLIEKTFNKGIKNE